MQVVCTDRKTNDTTDFQTRTAEPTISSSLSQAFWMERSFLNSKCSLALRTKLYLVGGDSQNRTRSHGAERYGGHVGMGSCCNTGRQGRERALSLERKRVKKRGKRSGLSILLRVV